MAVSDDDLREWRKRHEFPAMFGGESARIVNVVDELLQLRELVTQECSRCNTLQVCAPDGYEWEWRCADSRACDDRWESMHEKIDVGNGRVRWVRKGTQR